MGQKKYSRIAFCASYPRPSTPFTREKEKKRKKMYSAVLPLLSPLSKQYILQRF
jgi:hypothetical protein